ncbi:MAG: hypothetical protein ABL959_12160 [Pyrinomonadaceae bacterium]
MRRTLQNLVGELDRELLREHRFDTDLFGELTAIQHDSGILHGDRTISPFLRPYFLAESKYAAIRKVAALLAGAFGKLTSAALENDSIMDELGMSEKERRWARLETGYRDVSVTSRLDTFLTEDSFAFLEYNGETPAGVGDQAALERLYSHIPTVRRFLAANAHHYPQPHVSLISSLDQAYRESGGQKDKPNIAIVDWAGVSTGAEFEILADFFESLDYRTKICTPEELEYAGGVLTAGNFAIDVFYKRVIIHEFLDRFDEDHPVFRACTDGAVCMANSFRSKIPHKKSSFAILTDDRYQGLFDAHQLEAIRQHVPWTRNVQYGKTTYSGEAVDLVEFIRNERHRFVLKPNDDYGGKGIKFGWETSGPDWDDAIEFALSELYVVQERVPVEKTNIPVFADGEARMESLTVDFDPFLFRGVVEGGMVRLASGSLVNISQGGGETALAILKGF